MFMAAARKRVSSCVAAAAAKPTTASRARHVLEPLNALGQRREDAQGVLGVLDECLHLGVTWRPWT